MGELVSMKKIENMTIYAESAYRNKMQKLTLYLKSTGGGSETPAVGGSTCVLSFVLGKCLCDHKLSNAVLVGHLEEL